MCPPGSGKYSLLALALLGWACSIYGVLTYRPINGVWLLFLIVSLAGVGFLLRYLFRKDENPPPSQRPLDKKTVRVSFLSTRKSPWDEPDPDDLDDFDDAA